MLNRLGRVAFFLARELEVGFWGSGRSLCISWAGFVLVGSFPCPLRFFFLGVFFFAGGIGLGVGGGGG